MKIQKKLKITAAISMVGVATVLSGCASMFGDNTRAVTVNSNPQGAGVYIDNVQYGTTPSVITLPSYVYGGKVVTFKKPGYNDQSAMINSKFQPVGLWNLLFFPGFIVDAATGDMVKIDPTNLSVNATLQPVETVQPAVNVQPAITAQPVMNTQPVVMPKTIAS